MRRQNLELKSTLKKNKNKNYNKNILLNDFNEMRIMLLNWKTLYKEYR